MVYDSVNKLIFLFGGSCDDRYITSKDDLWTYDYVNNNWTELTPSYGPARRLNYAMAYDSDSQHIILFGGNSISAGWELADTWIYDYQTNSWSNAYPTTRPPGRSDHAMVYDPITKQTILFGGMRDVGDTTYLLNDTWAYDYEANIWTELYPTVAPPERYGTRMVFNTVEEKIVLYGGADFGDLEFDGRLYTFDATTTTWESLDSSTETSGARYWYGLTFDTHQNELIVFGGTDLEPEIYQSNETWVYSFDNNQWTNVTNDYRPPACSMQSMVYDPENKKVVLFGGLAYEPSEIYGTVWIYDPIIQEWIDLESGESSESQIQESAESTESGTGTYTNTDNSKGTSLTSMFLITGFGLLLFSLNKRKKTR
jgi:N-acetylneuraminic acid mutarotase